MGSRQAACRGAIMADSDGREANQQPTMKCEMASGLRYAQRALIIEAVVSQFK